VAIRSQLTVAGHDRLLNFLLSSLPGRGRNAVKGLLARRQVSVDGEVATRFDHPLEPGQLVVIGGSAGPGARLPGVRIVFEDDSLIVVEKRAGLLSVASAAERELTVSAILRGYLARAQTPGRVYTLHRLDRETSGLLMFAKTREVQERLQADWQAAVLERSYVALVEGRLEKAEGTITSWLKENKNLVMYSSRTPGDGEKATTHYRLLDGNARFSLLELLLETGKKNQIRVHMQDLGHSIVGDAKYGSSANPLHRLALHARVLAFRHPLSGRELRFETEIPADFLRLIGCH
jgi:23S rRNA pseudouridine1911/1915/1917 synthase